jgi:uncharacterized lipoprotein NlpE involved in copper resistance
MYFRGMRNIRFWKYLTAVISLLVAALMTSCGGGNEGGRDGAVGTAANPYQAISGIYEDTLPCLQCPGVLTRVELFTDSTFAYRERELGSDERSRTVSRYGTYILDADHTRITLTGVHGNWTKEFRRQGAQLLVLDAQGNPLAPESDYLIRKTDQPLPSQTAGTLRETNGAGGQSGLVYSRTLKNEVLVDAAFIRSAGEPVRALISYYTLAHETNCPAASCPVHGALELDEQGMRALATEWLGQNQRAADLLKSGLRSGDLRLLQIRPSAGGFEVSSVLNTPDGLKRLEDSFRLEEKRLVWVGSREGTIDRSAAEKNPDRKPEYQEGGKQVIRMDKLRENPKSSSTEKK